ncbi:MAG TPA: PAS domain-containing protein [Burkholderiaceae bacterium]|nr:PAS domain-containing protein [Burkholderiaceae bacterium]
MRIRTQLLVAIAVSLSLALVAVLLVVSAARDEGRASETLSRAQSTSHAVSGLLVLTQEYARHAERRVAQQWHQSHGAIAATLRTEASSRAASPALEELQAATQALPQLFTRLEEIGKGGDPFSQRRKEVLLDQLLKSTQAMSDYAYQWSQDAALVRGKTEREFQLAALAMPVCMLVLLVVLALVVRQRVLLPMARLDEAAAAIGRGDLSGRIASHAPDELGDLSRRFDQMAAALAQTSEQARQSERFVRLIADNLPTLIAYVDRNERYRFANAHYQGLLNIAPASLIGGTVAEGLRSDTYAVLRPYIDGALRGRRQQFERLSVIGGKPTYLRTDYLPDRAEDGSVVGLVSMVLDITELKEAQLAHAREEERVRSILTHAPDAFISIDAGGRIREWNRQAELSFGWQREEVLGCLIADVLFPAAHHQPYSAGAAHFAVNAQGATPNRRVETTALHRNGREIPIELSVAPVREGDLYSANAFLRDITERKQAEKQLQESEQRLRDITNNIPAMVGHFDAQERCLFANDTVLHQLGLKFEDIPRLTLRAGIGEANYALHEPHVRRVLQGEACNFEGHIQHKGRDAHYQAHLVPDRTSDGVVRGFYLMSFDVTAQRLADLARARSEQRLRQITDNLPVLISYLDKEQRLQFANATYNTWLGIDPRLVIGRYSREVFGPTLYEMRRPYIERALSGERVEFEDEAAVNGVLRITSVCYIPDIDIDGSVKGIYALTTDVTELKTVERRLHAQARFDTLTGLPNRLQYNEKLPEVLARAARAKDAVALMFLDIDHFKTINDTLGHAAGDAVLKAFAKRLASSVRLTDTVARLAGDEFVVILESLHNEDEPQFVARKIVAMVNQPFEIEGHWLDVTTSIGIAYHDGSMPPTTASKLLAKADEALYLAKAAGRNTYRVAMSDASATSAASTLAIRPGLH